MKNFRKNAFLPLIAALGLLAPTPSMPWMSGIKSFTSRISKALTSKWGLAALGAGAVGFLAYRRCKKNQKEEHQEEAPEVIAAKKLESLAFLIQKIDVVLCRKRYTTKDIALWDSYVDEGTKFVENNRNHAIPLLSRFNYFISSDEAKRLKTNDAFNRVPLEKGEEGFKVAQAGRSLVYEGLRGLLRVFCINAEESLKLQGLQNFSLPTYGETIFGHRMKIHTLNRGLKKLYFDAHPGEKQAPEYLEIIEGHVAPFIFS